MKIEQIERTILFGLLRSAVGEELLSEEEKKLYTAEMLPKIASVAKKHDLLHLLALGLKKNSLPVEDAAYFQNQIFQAVYRYEQLQYEFDSLCEALEKAQIPFLPLKGSVLRHYYPEPWMRTSCDIDVLVHQEDLDKAVAYLVETLEYEYDSKNSHDVSLFSPSGTHLELHYDLVEDNRANAASKVLESVWGKVEKRDGFEYCYEMPDELFYFYHIAHMAKHFEGGGCGIRPFIDLVVLNHKMEFDKEKRERLLEQGGLLQFAGQVELLSEIWFGNEAHTEITLQIQDYILQGGVYGTSENRIAVQQQKKGGKWRYALSRIFLPYKELKFHYPILEKHKWLMPIMQVRRWCKLIFCGHLKRATNELKYNSTLSKDAAEKTQELLKNIGL